MILLALECRVGNEMLASWMVFPSSGMVTLALRIFLLKSGMILLVPGFILFADATTLFTPSIIAHRWNMLALEMINPAL